MVTDRNKINLWCLSISVKVLSKLFQLKGHKNADWFTRRHSSKFKLDYEISSSLILQANITDQIILSNNLFKEKFLPKKHDIVWDIVLIMKVFFYTHCGRIGSIYNITYKY